MSKQDDDNDNDDEKIVLFVGGFSQEQMRKNFIRLCVESDRIERILDTVGVPL